ERAALSREALTLALASGDKLVAIRANVLSWAASWEQGDLDGAQAHALAHDGLASQFRHRRFGWSSTGFHAASALWGGRFGDAERWFRLTEEVCREDEARGAARLAFPVGFCRAAERYGDLPGIESRLRAGFAAMRQELSSCVAEMLIAQLHGRAGNRQR